MKPILVNINEISDSREVYESKPNIFFSIFIYTVLTLFIVALLWMYIGRIDVVVKSEGMLRPNDQVATIINSSSGTLEEVNVEDGIPVVQGDVLYIIEHGDLLTEQEYYMEQLADTQYKLTMLKKYKKSIEDGINHFTQEEGEGEYYLKYQAYELNYNLMKNDYSYSEKERILNLDSTLEQLAILNQKLSYSKQLKKAVASGKNVFANTGEQKEYYNLFLKYRNDYDSILTQYSNAKKDIDNSTTEQGLVDSLEYYQSVLEGMQQLKLSINEGSSVFREKSTYSLQYDEYVNKIADLTAAYEQAKENYEINNELKGLSVTEWEVQQSETAMEEAGRAVSTYQVNFLSALSSNITDMEKKIEETALAKDNTVSKDVLYRENEDERKAALDNYKLKYLVELDNTITTLEENISTLETNRDRLKLQGEKNLMMDNGDEEAKLVEYRNSELRSTIASIDSYSDKAGELRTTLDKLNTQIDQAVVKATRTGIVNSNVELVKGDILSSGTEVLTIIPQDNNKFKVNIYVSNENIGKLRPGMEAKFNIYALPNREYGYMTGTITSISKDLKVDPSSGSGYYLVEASLGNKTLYDSKGNKGELKAGMSCQAQMITERKRILTYVLEKIDLWND
ncbi:MAG TPA: HlyD family efflux transporter periplasmic adaptor subunit [Clostridiales bacterium]|nr:HlyD family efflux transporter periplasmic adaptor subunit [Clostridiales bacterium]